MACYRGDARERGEGAANQHPCGHDGGEPVFGSTNPGGPQPPTSFTKLTGDENTGLPLAMAGSQHEICGFSYVGLASLPFDPELSTVDPT